MWPAEGSFFESLCDDPVSGAVPVKDLDEVAAFIGEEEGGSASWIDFDGVAGDLGEAVEALSHVDGCEGDVDFEVAIEGEHDGLYARALIRAARSSTEVVSHRRAVAPPGSWMSSPGPG